MTLPEAMHYFVNEAHIMDSLSIGFGKGEAAFTYYTRADDASLYDLASLTKLFTVIAVMQLVESGRIDLSAPLKTYDRRFINLENRTIASILSYQEAIVTEKRIDEAVSKRDALALLFAAAPAPNKGTRFYSDMHAMVLKYTVEGASGMGFFDYLKAYILTPCRMLGTWAAVPQSALPHTQSYTNEHRIVLDELKIRSALPLGTPHDPKAALLSPHGEDLCGHAGLFSTLPDMVSLCRALLDGNLLQKSSLDAIAENRTGRPLPDGTHTQYLGYLCFVKHPNQYFSELPAYMTNSAFGLSGFTGNHISIDPALGIYNVFLGNRCLNRLTVLTPKNLEKYGLNPDGTGHILSPDGTKIYSSVDYVHKKDACLHAPIDKILQSLTGQPFRE